MIAYNAVSALASATPTILLRNAPSFGLFADLNEPTVHAVLLHQLRMGAALGNAPVFYHKDLVGFFNGRKKRLDPAFLLRFHFVPFFPKDFYVNASRAGITVSGI